MESATEIELNFFIRLAPNIKKQRNTC